MTRDDYVSNFQARVLHDAWLEATTRYWLARAATFEAARPRRGDYWPPGTAAAHVAAVDDRLAATAQACRHRAAETEASRHQLAHTLADLTGQAVA